MLPDASRADPAVEMDGLHRALIRAVHCRRARHHDSIDAAGPGWPTGGSAWDSV
jgi:hypothetical protein